MTDRKEIERLAAEVSASGATVTVSHDRDGYISTVMIQGAEGIGSHPMSPLAAAERMREYLYRIKTQIVIAHVAMMNSLEELIDSPNAKQNAMWDRARAALALAKKG